MLLDGGRVRGGFPTEYGARILPPQDSAIVAAIAKSVGTDRYQKVDVQIEPLDGKPWIFSTEGTAETTSIFSTPNPLIVGVATTDGVRFVDTSTHNAVQLLEMPVECAATDVQGKRLFLATAIYIVAIDVDKCVWQSRRISLDGVRMLTYANGYVNGVGMDVADETKPFSINANTGEATGGFTRW